MTNERGSITVWGLGLSLMLFSVGFLSLDLWSVFSARSQAAAIADTAAIAGATALDEQAWRAGRLELESSQAHDRAIATATAHPSWTDDMSVSVDAAPTGVTVNVTRNIPFRFVAALVPDQNATVTVTGYATPGEGT